MLRNLFAAFATLMLGAGAASASASPTTDTAGLSLEQRVLAAQRTISRMMEINEEQVAKPGSDKVVYWHNWHNYDHPWANWHNWHNWDNWSNWHNWHNYGPHGY